ncbi:MAG: DUF4037 domain-containing protein [Acidimicrobiia bacterium]
MTESVGGLELARHFYMTVVEQLLTGIPHAAALLGEGSEVLGLDTERSTDHSWGPRLNVFVGSEDVERARSVIGTGLPDEFQGRPVRYPRWQTGRVEHHVEVATVGAWFESYLGFDPRESITTAQRLATPQQLLLEVTSGKVFRDDLGELTAVRQLLSWYPDDVWLWLMACQWHLLAEVEPLVGRTAEVGDELGSRILAARQVENLIRLCLLQERCYAPYGKWMVSAFNQVEASRDLAQHVQAAVSADDYPTRETALVRAYEALAARHNALEVSDPIDPSAGPFQVEIADAVRPYQVINAARFASACQKAIRDDKLRELPLIGSIDQFETNDLVTHFTDPSTRFSVVYGEL